MSERRTANDERRTRWPHSASTVYRWMRRACVLVCVLLVCGACSPASEQAAQQLDDPAGGSRFGPESVAENFFKDLHDALQDPKLADDATRSRWAEKLANYFAPNEREDQRVALSTALDDFVSGRGRLEQNESLTIDVRFGDVVKISENGNRALVRLTDASIYILITRTTDRGFVTLYEDDVPLSKIIGDTNGAVPVIRIGRTWFLTEG